MTQKAPSRSDLPQLHRQLRLTRAGLWAERLTAAFWPAASLLAAVYGLTAIGLLAALPPALLAALALLILALFAALIWRGARRFRAPRPEDAFLRLDATLPGRPLSALRDAQAVGAADPASAELWAAHQARMAERAKAARAPRPALSQTRADPYALRLIALTFAAVGLLFGTPLRLTELHRTTAADPALLNAGPVWEGWIRPPAYSGRPAVYLNGISDAGLEVPQGARAILRFYGEAGALTLSETVSGRPLEPGAGLQSSAEFDILQHGEITISGPGGRSWQIGVLRDVPPSVEIPAAPEREADGRMKLPFTAADDYGLRSGTALITLDLPKVARLHGLQPEPEPREAITLDLPMPFTGRRREIAETLIGDLAAHPFANLPVIITLSVTDVAGQTSESEPLSTVLPGRRFFDPLAAALSETRRDLLWTAANSPRAAQLLRAVTWKPEEFIHNQRAFLRLRSVIRRLEASQPLAPELRDEIAEELFAIALLLEEGDLNSALERLRRAQDRLDEAMRNGASDSEIAGLMEELRRALDNYMQQLARESERAPSEQSADTKGLEMSADQLQQMLDRLEQLMAEGKMAEAQELMELLRQLMENMQVTQGAGNGQGGEGEGAMRDLAETLRDQQGLSDEAFRQLQKDFDRDMGGDQPSQGQSEGEGNEGEGAGAGERSLEERQRDLRNRLRALGQTEMPGDGSSEADEARRALERSREAMEGAEDALRENNLPRALDRQAEAIEALREGMRRFGDAMARDQASRGDAERGESDSSGSRPGESRSAQNRDPLGRQTGQSGAAGATDDPLHQGEDPYRRALDLLEELRKRSGEQLRPEDERDYLRRLLEQF